MLHQVAASVVNDDRVRHAVLAKLPGGQAGTLVAGPGLVNPNVDRDACIVRFVDWCQRRTPIDGREPTGVAVS